MGFLQKVYGRLPVFMQHAAVSLYGYQWKKRRFGGIFERQLTEFKDRENYSVQQWDDYKTKALRKILYHAFTTVPYYNSTFKKAGVNESKLALFELDHLSQLPFLPKNDLRQFGTTALVSVNREPKGEFFSSSGSTGTPTQILFSYPMHQRWSAGFEARIRHWAGVDRFTPRGVIGGRRVLPEGNSKPPYYRYNSVEKQVYFSAYHIARSTAVDYLKGIYKYGAEYMTGYAMSNFFLARFFQELNLTPPALKAVITSSEKLTLDMRKTFEKVYQCKTFDSWSGVEACGLVSQCEHGSLHVSPDLGIIELLNDQGKPVKPGETGEVVCTGLINFDQPLIRYRIGDRMQLDDKSCKCGRAMPVIKEIIGRVEDTIIGKDGREMVRFHGIFINLPNVVEAQLIQYDYHDFLIRIVTTGNFTKQEELLIRERMRSQLGDIKLIIEEVESIARNSNGKFQAVISKIKRKS